MEVSPDDISRMVRLVQEVCDRWDDPRVWREYLLHGACALLSGHMGTTLADSASGQGGENGVTISCAFSGSSLASLVSASSSAMS